MSDNEPTQDDHDVSPQRQQSPDMMASAETPPVDAQTEHDWSAFYDDSGQIYYYNNVTGESSWDVPEGGFNPPPEDEAPNKEDDTAEATVEKESEPPEEDKSEQEDEKESKEAGHVEAVSTGGSWAAYTDDDGQVYYYNSETGQTQWEKPEEMDSISAPEPADDAKDQDQPTVSEQPKSPTETPKPMDIDEQEEPKEEEPEEDEPEEEIDPIVKKLEDATSALAAPDAILEPNVLGNVGELVTQLGGKAGAEKAMKSLIDGFNGQSAMCGLLGLWMVDLKSSASSDSSSNAAQLNGSRAADNVRKTVQDTINKLAKERFTKEGGENILNLSKKDVTFLEDMMDSDRWRKLLIDLSASNKDNALLMYCLEAISQKGHHREIARRINQSDHFAVYNAMVASEFAVVGAPADSSSSDGEAALGIEGLIGDLRRTCTSTSYTYLYAMEVLQALLSRARKGSPSNVHRLALRKWERLREELESAMIDPSTSASTAGASPLFRKRRLDIALTISELYQKKRRRLKHSPEELSKALHGNDNHSETLESALLNLLKRHSLGTRLDDRLLDQLLQHETGLGGKGKIAKLLQSHPLSIKVLLDHLFKPGASRTGSGSTKQKCARLIALAVISAEDVAITEAKGQANGSSNIATDTEEISLTSKLISGSQLCETVENKVSFTVTADEVNGEEGLSPGRKLSSLALKNAVVAQGVVMWATEIAKGPEFVTSASYQTLTPSILSLLRLISVQHPFTRRAIIDIPFIFLKHTNSEISFKKMNALKEQSLRLLLFLFVKGEVKHVLGEISGRLRQKDNSEIDASLVRYLVGGMLDVICPPYSVQLVRCLGHLLSSPRCVEALRSTYFNDAQKKKLTKVIDDFQVVAKSPSCSHEDTSLVSTLASTYS